MRRPASCCWPTKDSLFLSPDGHGGTVAALAASGAIDDMRRRGIEHLFYLQVDNPLVPIGDAEFIGYHLLAESELTSMAVAKQTPQDRLGNFAMIDGRLQVIEYSDFPDDVAEQRDAERLAGVLGRQHRGARVSRGVSGAGAGAEGRAAVPHRPQESAVRRRRGRTGRADAAERAEVRAVHFRSAAARQESDGGRICRGTTCSRR